MNILLTGGAGFIGSNVLERLLSEQHFVVVIDNYDPFYSKRMKMENLRHSSNNPNFFFEENNLESVREVEDILKKFSIEIVIHLAGKAGVRPSVDEPESYYRSNVMATLNLLIAMKNSNVNKIIFGSSSSVYGNNEKVPFSETDNVDNPISPYAASKRAAELLLYTYHSLYKVSVLCFRFFTVYGPRQRPDLAIRKFTEKIAKGLPIEIYGDGSFKRDFTYVDDIASCIADSISKVNGYEIINLGNENPCSVLDLVKLIEVEFEKKANIIFLPENPGDVNLTYADISKARLMLGYSPQTNLSVGIKKFVNWYKKEMNLS